MNHIVLLGDSIFDNGSYVHRDRGEEPVIDRLQTRLPILDLRRICHEDADYSDISPIEPAAGGSAKTARAIWRIAGRHDFSRPHTVVFAREVLSEQQNWAPNRVAAAASAAGAENRNKVDCNGRESYRSNTSPSPPALQGTPA